MKIENFLKKVCEQIKYKPARKEIAEELEIHIQDLKEEYLCKGYLEKEAEEKAINQMGEAEEIGKKLNKIHRPKLDWKLVILILILIFFGFLVALNRGFFTVAVKDRVENYTALTLSATLSAYIFTLFIAILCSIIIYLLDYRKISKFSLQLYILGTMLNIVAYIFGVREGTNVLWGLPVVRVSPIVFTIPLYVISFAGLINNITSVNKKSITKIILLSLASILVIGAINFESALIVAITYAIISTSQLLKLKQNKIKYIIGVWAIPVIMLIFFTFGIIVGVKLVANSNTFLNAFIQKDEIIASAKLFGKIETKDVNGTFFVKNTSFAFLSLLGNYGWFVTIGMVLCVILLNVKLIINAAKIKNLYGKLVIISIASIFILETIFSIVMNLLSLPAEFSIPLVSYGKVSLIVNMICLALVLSIYKTKNINIYNKEIKHESSY